MCGFAGFCDARGRFYKNGRRIARQMSDRIIHRGPDSRGEYSDKFLSVAFNRLEIIDLSGGGQPMLSTDGRYLICFNGEIYNYRTLRSELREKHGIKFRTASDTEVLLYACAIYGREALTHLRGMYSFVFYDRLNRSVLMARDPFGIKPLYYGIFDGALIFASEIKAFLEHPLFKKELNTEVLPYYLQFQYVPTEETAFKGVKRLLPGHILTYDGKDLDTSRYFSLPKRIGRNFTPYTFFGHPVSAKKQEIGMRRASDTLFSVIGDSVRAHLESDVPVGAFLSGGVDSGLICALAKPKTAFSVGFDNVGFDERRDAAETALHVGTELASIKVTADDFFSALPNVQYHSDEPYANLSAVPLYLVARRASSDVKVVLSGEGADELFGGYELYADGRLTGLYKRMPYALRRFALRHSAPFGERIKSFTERNLPPLEDSFIGQARIMSPAEAYLILNKKYRSIKRAAGVTSKHYSEVAEGSELQKKMYLDQNLWLPLDILNKADKMTMANSLELRVPYLDLKVLAVSGTLSDRLLVRNKTTKLILRKSAMRVLPESVASRPKKGFPVPFREWIREDAYRDKLEKAFKSESCTRFFESERLLEMLSAHVSGKENNARALYTVYAFLIWYDRFFGNDRDGKKTTEDTKEKNEEKRDKISADTARLG